MPIRLSAEHAATFEGVRNATKLTMPSHIWLHEVDLYAARTGVPESIRKEWRPHITSAYSYGEPVELAVMTLATVADIRRTKHAPSPREQLRDACRACEEVLSRGRPSAHPPHR